MSSATMPDMAHTKPHKPPTEERAREVHALLDQFTAHGWTAADIARGAGVSKTSARKWLRWHQGETDDIAFPSDGNVGALRKAAQDLLGSVTKVIRADEAASQGVLSELGSTTYGRPTLATEEAGGVDMAKLVASRAGEFPGGARYPELEVCLWYNRREIAAGAIRREIIQGARADLFALRGCADWNAPEWWKQLLAADAAFRKSFEPPSGTHPVVPPAAKPLAPRPPKKPK